MQSPVSIGLISGIVFLAALAIALTVAASALVAVPFFLIGLVVFLLWRGKRRAEPVLRQRAGARVPTTEEAAADPAGDSGVRDAARSATSRSHAT